MSSIHWSHKECLFKLFPLIITISFAMDVFVPAIPNMSEYFKTDSAHMQASLYVFMLTVALGQLLIGPLADSIGRRRTAQYSALLFFIGSLLSSLSNSLPFLLIARIIQAMGACGTYLLCFIIVRDNYSTTSCGRLFSLLSGTNAITASLAPIIGGILLDMTGNWRSEFYFLTLLGLFILVSAYNNIPDYDYQKPTPLKSAHGVWKNIIFNDDFQTYSLISATCLLGLYLFCALSPEILMTKLHLNGTHYGLWFGLNAFTSFISNLFAARLTGHQKLEWIVKLGLKIMLTATLSMMVLAFFQLTLLGFMLPMLLLTVGISLSMGCSTALALKDMTQNTGKATSLISAFQFGLAGSIGILITFWQLTPMSLALPMLIFILLSNLKLRT